MPLSLGTLEQGPRLSGVAAAQDLYTQIQTMKLTRRSSIKSL